MSKAKRKVKNNDWPGDKKSRSPSWTEYEARKYEWIRSHAGATSAEYVAFIRDLAEELGL